MNADERQQQQEEQQQWQALLAADPEYQRWLDDLEREMAIRRAWAIDVAISAGKPII